MRRINATNDAPPTLSRHSRDTPKLSKRKLSSVENDTDDATIVLKRSRKRKTNNAEKTSKSTLVHHEAPIASKSPESGIASTQTTHSNDPMPPYNHIPESLHDFAFPDDLARLYRKSQQYHKSYTQKNNLLLLQSKHIHAKDELLIRLMKREEFEKRRVASYLDKLNHVFPSVMHQMRDFIAQRIHNDNEVRMAALLLDKFQETWHGKMIGTSNAGAPSAAVGPVEAPQNSPTKESTAESIGGNTPRTPSTAVTPTKSNPTDEKSSFFLTLPTDTDKRSDIPSPRSFFHELSNQTASEILALLQEGSQIDTATKLKEYISERVSEMLQKDEPHVRQQNPDNLLTSYQTPEEREDIYHFQTDARVMWWQMLDFYTLQENDIDGWICEWESIRPREPEVEDPNSIAKLIVDVSSDDKDTPVRTSNYATPSVNDRHSYDTTQVITNMSPITAPTIDSPSKKIFMHENRTFSPSSIQAPTPKGHVIAMESVSCQTDHIHIMEKSISTGQSASMSRSSSPLSHTTKSISPPPPSIQLQDPDQFLIESPHVVTPERKAIKTAPQKRTPARIEVPTSNSPQSPVSSPLLRSSTDAGFSSRVERTPLAQKHKLKKLTNQHIQTDATSFMALPVKVKKKKPQKVTGFSQTDFPQTRHSSVQKDVEKPMIHNQFTQCNRDEESNVWRRPRGASVEHKRTMIRQEEEITKLRHVITLLRSKCQQLRGGSNSDMIGVEQSLKILDLQSIDDLDNLDFDIFSSSSAWEEEKENVTLDSGNVDTSRFLNITAEQFDEGTMHDGSAQLFITSPLEVSPVKRRASWIPKSHSPATPNTPAPYPDVEEDSQLFLDSPLVPADFGDSNRRLFGGSNSTPPSRPASTSAVYRDTYPHSTKKRITRRMSQTPDVPSAISLHKADYDSVRYKVRSEPVVAPSTPLRRNSTPTRSVAPHSAYQRRRSVTSASSTRKRSSSVKDFPPMFLP